MINFDEAFEIVKTQMPGDLIYEQIELGDDYIFIVKGNFDDAIYVYAVVNKETGEFKIFGSDYYALKVSEDGLYSFEKREN